MPGIIVGVDGSAPSQRALEWAMKEAVIRHAPLTVLTVHQAVAGYYGGVAVYSEDPELTDKAREAAQTETDKMLAGLSGSTPDSVTVTAVHGFPVEELIKAGSDADMIVLGSRGAGGFTRLLMDRSPVRSPSTRPARSSSSLPRRVAERSGRQPRIGQAGPSGFPACHRRWSR